MKDKLFVYGSLEDDRGPKAALYGFTRRTDAPYPTIEPAVDFVQGHIIEVDDWADMDRYEGHSPADPDHSLYWRLECQDGTQVYVGNPERAKQVWLEVWDVSYTRDEIIRYLNAATLEVLD